MSRSSPSSPIRRLNSHFNPRGLWSQGFELLLAWDAVESVSPLPASGWFNTSGPDLRAVAAGPFNDGSGPRSPARGAREGPCSRSRHRGEDERAPGQRDRDRADAEPVPGVPGLCLAPGHLHRAARVRRDGAGRLVLELHQPRDGAGRRTCARSGRAQVGRRRGRASGTSGNAADGGRRICARSRSR